MVQIENFSWIVEHGYRMKEMAKIKLFHNWKYFKRVFESYVEFYIRVT